MGLSAHCRLGLSEKNQKDAPAVMAPVALAVPAVRKAVEIKSSVPRKPSRSDSSA